MQGIARGAWADVTGDAQDAALCAYAVKLTRTPSAMEEADVSGLRAVGLDDVAIHDAVQVIGALRPERSISDTVDASTPGKSKKKKKA